MKPLISMRRALSDPALFGRVFAGESWAKWRILLIAAMGEELDTDERAIFTSLTGREREPLKPIEEAWLVMGRRSGKTRAIAILAAYIAALNDFSDVLAPGERATLPILSASLWQAGKAFQFLSGIFADVPALKKLVEAQTADTINLATRVDIECRPVSFRTIRSGTAIAIIGDEASFWRNDDSPSANPDVEVLNAARPLLATTGGPLIVISSPYAKRGAVWAAFKRHFGPEGDPLILVATAPSQLMNPTLSRKVITRAFERDPVSAASEYGSLEAGICFRSDVESFIDHDAVDACVVPGRYELPHQPGMLYNAFVDLSGGGADSMTLAITHAVGQRIVVDVVREVRQRHPPVSPESVVADFAEVMKTYRVARVTGDNYAGEWPKERFRMHGITYDKSESVRSDIYRNLLPILNSSSVELLDNKRLIAQLCNLERQCARSGKDSINHPSGGHDDLINAVAGAVTLAGTPAHVSIPPAVAERMRHYQRGQSNTSPFRRNFNRDAANQSSIGELLHHQQIGAASQPTSTPHGLVGANVASQSELQSTMRGTSNSPSSRDQANRAAQEDMQRHQNAGAASQPTPQPHGLTGANTASLSDLYDRMNGKK